MRTFVAGTRRFSATVSQAKEFITQLLERYGEDLRRIHFRRPAYKYVLSVQDMALLCACIWLTHDTVLQPAAALNNNVASFHSLMLPVTLGFIGCAYMILHGTGSYKIQSIVALPDLFRSVSLSFVLGGAVLGLGLGALVWLNLIAVVNISELLRLVLTSALLFCAARVIFRSVFLTLAVNGVYTRTLVIAGAGSIGRELATSLAENPSFGLRTVGFLDDHLPIGSPVCRGLLVIGRLSSASRIINERKVDELIACPEECSPEQFLSLLDRCSMTRALVNVAASNYGVRQPIFIERYGTVPVVGAKNFPRLSYAGLPVLKRLLDIVGSSIGLILLAPVFAVVAIAIKLESRGPVFYKQTRIGKGGMPFTFWKFRSMHVGSDRDRSREAKYVRLMNGTLENGKGSSPTKIVDESKITRLGRFIRKTSIDELPQLLHVLTGHMSLVGPRPCLPYEWKHYEEWHKSRLDVTPGCTGVWQVIDRSKAGFNGMVMLDLFYIHNISFHVDVWLILKTFPTMIFGRGGR